MTISESCKLIRRRNQIVNNKSLSNSSIQVQTCKIASHKRWFHEIALLTTEPLLIVSVLVTYNFQPCVKIINLDINISLETNVERTLNIKSKLYQAHKERAVTTYTSLKDEYTTATLWPFYTFSSPH